MEQITSKRKRKKSNFGAVSELKKQKVLDSHKSDNTKKATKLWMDLFKDYLNEKSLPEVDLVCTADLPEVIENFYIALRSKKKVQEKDSTPNKLDKKNSPGPEEDTDENEDCMYANSTMKSIRAALNRYFKETRRIDITSDASFAHTNKIFTGILKLKKSQGRGTVTHKKPISDEDLSKIFAYFKHNMAQPPNGKNLQDILLFYIIYFTARRGRENLRDMTKDTFKVSEDADGGKFIYQAIDEKNKNHDENIVDPSTQGRIYEIKGKISH